MANPKHPTEIIADIKKRYPDPNNLQRKALLLTVDITLLKGLKNKNAITTEQAILLGELRTELEEIEKRMLS